uniref:HTH myb-type domain-containing protein n=1 Tax=Leersia perrieri TaxID=77586 RepID=A0A0D9UXF7_9ORYZ
MASSSSDLTLDYKPNGDCGGGGGAYPKQSPAAAAAIAVDHGQATQKLQEFLSRLEEERLKIDAFKRELPLCMQLLNHAMEAYRQQLEAYQMGSQSAAAARPLVLEEFIPLKNIGIDVTAAAAEKAAAASEKASWMVSAQLWNAPANGAAAAKGPETPKEHSEQQHHPLAVDSSPRLIAALDAGGGGVGGGAFLPFSKEINGGAMAGDVGSNAAALPELALAPAEKVDAIAVAGEGEKKPYAHDNNGVAVARSQNGGKTSSSSAPDGHAVGPPPASAPQTHRKARRCWSPELHRRFVNALQILGGAQVATPKQIRELMKVDGLTNDEVKSHLQKYRLHTRRPMAAAPAATAAAPQLVVLGGIWVPPEYATQAAGPAIYGAHPATPQPHYTAVAAHEYYHHHHHHQSPSAAAAVHHLQHHPAAAALVHHRAVAAAPPPPQPVAPAYSSKSPDSDGRGSGGGGGGRDRSESIDEEGQGDQEREDDDDDDEMAAATAANDGAGADDDDDEINAATTSAGGINY